MQIHIEIYTNDQNLGNDLMGTPTFLNIGGKRELSTDAILELKGVSKTKAFGFPETIELVLSFGIGATSSLLASWLYEKIKGRATNLRIDRTEVFINKGEIEKLIVEKIENHKS